MSVRVNLLPSATKDKDRATQQLAVLLAAVGVLVVALAGVWWWASNQVRDAEDRLAAEQVVSAGLRADQVALAAYSDLADRRREAEEVLTASLAGEASLAGLLQDLAAVMPPDAQIDSLSILIDADPDPEVRSVGLVNMTGRSLTSHAPGVERVLISLEQISTLGGLHLNTSTIETDPEVEVDPIASFAVDGLVQREALTGRYVDGLPGGLQ